MASSNFLPDREAKLLSWSRVFSAGINANPVAVGLTPAMAASYDALNSAFAAAYRAANESSTRTTPSIVAKNDAKKALIAEARRLARIIRAATGVTAAQRAELGLSVADAESPRVNPPSESPRISIVGATGHTVTFRLRDQSSPTSRGKPAGVQGAVLFSYVAESPEDSPPVDISEWTFQGLTSRTKVKIVLSGSEPPGSAVWVTAYWINPRLERGPVAKPQSTNIPGGVLLRAGNLQQA